MSEVKKPKRLPLAQRLAQLALERRGSSAPMDHAAQQASADENIDPEPLDLGADMLVAQAQPVAAESAETLPDSPMNEFAESHQAAAASVVAAYGSATAEADEAEIAQRELEASLDAAQAQWDEAQNVAEQSALEADSELGLATFRVSLNDSADSMMPEDEAGTATIEQQGMQGIEEQGIEGYDASIDGVMALIEDEIERLKSALETYRLLNHPQKGDIIRWHVRRLDERQDQLEELERMLRAGEPLH